MFSGESVYHLFAELEKLRQSYLLLGLLYRLNKIKELIYFQSMTEPGIQQVVITCQSWPLFYTQQWEAREAAYWTSEPGRPVQAPAGCRRCLWAHLIWPRSPHLLRRGQPWNSRRDTYMLWSVNFFFSHRRIRVGSLFSTYIDLWVALFWFFKNSIKANAKTALVPQFST